MGDINGKVWGTTELVYQAAGVECHLIHADSGGYCSKHRHLHKFNRFHVISGTLEVEVWKQDYKLCDTTILEAGDSMTVKPGEFHRFIAIKDVVALEFYWSEMDPNDIEREDVGGTR